MPEVRKLDTLNAIFTLRGEQDKTWIRFYRGPGNSEQHGYGSLLDGARRVTHFLRRSGLKKGDVVAIMLPTHADFIHSFFGILLAGGVPVALYPPVRMARIDEWKESTRTMLKTVRAVGILTDKLIGPLLHEPVQGAGLPLGIIHVATLQKKEPIAEETYAGSPEDLAFIQFSSGTTGNPKPVAVTQKSVLANSQAILGLQFSKVPQEQAHGVSWLPLYHDMGLVGILFGGIVAGAPLTLIRPEVFVAKPAIWFQAISEAEGQVITAAPNFAFGLCTKRIRDKDLEGLDLSRWKVSLCGAEAVHPEVLEKFVRRFQPYGLDAASIKPCYGLAEATLAVTFTPMGTPMVWQSFDRESMGSGGVAKVRDGGLKLASVGRPLPGVSLEIRSPEGEVLEPNRIGRIWIKGPSVMREYLHLPEATTETLQDGWLDSGDRGFIYDGSLYICGRDKEVIIIRGRNYDPAVLERPLFELPRLREGCFVALGVPDEASGTENLVILAETRDYPLSAETNLEIVDEIKNLIHARHGLPVKDVLLSYPGAFFRTSSGKIRRVLMKELYLQRRVSLFPPKFTRIKVIGERLKGQLAQMVR